MTQDIQPQNNQEKISVISLPEEFKKAKNRLFYASLLLILIIVFSPTFTGFLGNFSVKVAHYPTLFIFSILFALTWLAIRYTSLFSTIFVDNRLLLLPLKALNEIYISTSNNHTQIIEADTEHRALAEQFESLNRIYPKLDKQNQIASKHNIKRIKKDLKSKEKQINGLKIQRTGLKFLIGMDILTPFFTYLVAAGLLVWNMQDISQSIHKSEEKASADYKVESATIEVKDIKLKELK